MYMAKKLAIKELHECIHWNAEAMVKIESGDVPMTSQAVVRKRLAYWLAKFHRLHVN